MMPFSPENSSPPGGASSINHSPGTDATFYTPVLNRYGQVVHVASSKAASKQPLAPLTAPPVYAQPAAHQGVSTSAVQTVSFSNELDPQAANFESRYLHVDVFPTGANYPENALQQVEAVMKAHQPVFHKAVPLRLESHTSGDVYIRFDDISDAADAKAIFGSQQFVVSFVSQQQFANAKYQDLSSVHEYEGQVNVAMSTRPLPTTQDIPVITAFARELLGQFGSIRKLSTISDHDVLVFRVEFNSLDASNRACQVLHRELVWTMAPNKFASFACEKWSGFSTTTTPTTASLQIVPPLSLQNALIPGRRHPNDQHNRVRRERILDGSDIRTTVMLRNIPNKMDWLCLKSLLDKYCFGTYDFVYLRIDFLTGCNVGYAFINFVDTNGMTSMLDNIEHRAWEGFRSSKAAEISYATIQGKEALVSKFRNSSVMQETPYCRPRLFVSSDDEIARINPIAPGTELEFPAPDNLAKLHRSIDSARATGLYPPNGAGLIDHRARQGLYDNGNPRDHFVHHMNLPAQLQQEIEMGYACANGFHFAPFHQIPRDFVEKFLAVKARDTTSAWSASTAGVIGQRGSPHEYGTTNPIVPYQPARGHPRQSPFELEQHLGHMRLL